MNTDDLILGLNTATPTCQVYLNDTPYEWEAGRTLAHGLLAFLEECLAHEQKTFADITGIVIFRGPGSFTGLRIGMAVADTIAESQSVPIVGETGDEWLAEGTTRLAHGDNDRIVLPEYGGDAHITLPKK